MKPQQRIYIAGPMSGREAYNVFEFNKAARAWVQLGHTVITPFDTNSMVWRCHYGRDFDPYQDKCEWSDPIMNEMQAADFTALLAADAVVLLEGWRHSKGARTEVLIARNSNKPIYDATTFQKLDLNPILIIEGV